VGNTDGVLADATRIAQANGACLFEAQLQRSNRGEMGVAGRIDCRPIAPRSGPNHVWGAQPKGQTMPKILVHHDVDDTEHWLAQPTREEFFGPLGVTDIKTYTNPEKPTQVGLTMDVPDLDALVAALQTPEAAEAMKKDGVHADTVVICVESQV
jgi:hypothetical protein